MMNIFSNKQLVILSAFIDNAKKSLYVRELERLSGIDIKILSSELNALVDNNILDYEARGKIKLYSLKSTPESEAHIMMAEIYRSNAFLDRHLLLKPRLHELGNLCDFVIFGIYAKNNPTKGSDLDIVVFAKPDENIRKILRSFNIKVHPQFIMFNEFQKLCYDKNSLVNEMMSNHILFGKHKEFARMILGWTGSDGVSSKRKESG